MARYSLFYGSERTGGKSLAAALMLAGAIPPRIRGHEADAVFVDDWTPAPPEPDEYVPCLKFSHEIHGWHGRTMPEPNHLQAAAYRFALTGKGLDLEVQRLFGDPIDIILGDLLRNTKKLRRDWAAWLNQQHGLGLTILP